MKRSTLPAVAVAALVVGLGSTSPAVGQAANRAATASVQKCPAHAPKFTAVAGVTSRFVRPNAQLIRLCRFYKVNWADSFALWRHRLIRDGATISSLTHSFNKLKEPQRGIFCMKDDGSEMLLVFGYADGTQTRVVVKLSGCRFASNGKALRSTTGRLHSRLLALSRNQ